jgi:predicted Zn-dependent protease
MSDLATEIQSDGGQLIENGEIVKEFPNGTIDSNGQVLLGKRREAGGNATVQKRRQPTASKAGDSKSEESIIAVFCIWIVDHQIGELQAQIVFGHLLTLWQALL